MLFMLLVSACRWANNCKRLSSPFSYTYAEDSNHVRLVFVTKQLTRNDSRFRHYTWQTAWLWSARSPFSSFLLLNQLRRRFGFIYILHPRGGWQRRADWFATGLCFVYSLWILIIIFNKIKLFLLFIIHNRQRKAMVPFVYERRDS
jgi:hypothetical protein